MTTRAFRSLLILLTGLSLGETLLNPSFAHALEVNQLSLQSIRWPQAQALLKSKNLSPQPVTVAVIDTGVAIFHPALRGRILTNSLEIPGNKNDDDQNGFVDDYFGYDFISKSGFQIDSDGHGTHVAGLIAQLNPQARLLAIRVLGQQGGSPEDIAQAIQYAADRGAKVINLSLGGASQLAQVKGLYEKAIQYAREKNVLILSAAGNNYGSNNDQFAFFPANTWDDNAMAVCSSELNGTLSDFSNYGPWRVHLCAPGRNLLSAHAGYNPLIPQSPLLVAMSGTSQATPLASAAASLLYGLNPNFKPYQVRDILMKSTTPSSSLKGLSQTGGVLNMESAIQVYLNP